MALDCEPGPGGFRFIWKPAQSNCLPTQPPHSYALPLYLTVGKMEFRQTGQSKAGGTPAMSRAGSLRAGLCRPGFELIKNIFHKPPKFGLTAPFLRGCPPREMRAPPGRCPPCPTLSQSKRCAVSSCTRLWRPRGRPVFRPTCALHAVRCLGSLFLGVFLPNRVRNIENMSLFFGAGLLYTRGWGLRPGGVLLVH